MVVEEVVICRHHLSDSLFHHLRVLFFQPREVLVLEKFAMKVFGQVRNSKVLLCFLVDIHLIIKHVIINISVATKEFVEFNFLLLIRI